MVPPLMVACVTSIQAGMASWNDSTLFISWELGTDHFDVLTDPLAALVVGRANIAVYNGGRNLVVMFGKATVHGQDILAGTIGASITELVRKNCRRDWRWDERGCIVRNCGLQGTMSLPNLH